MVVPIPHPSSATWLQMHKVSAYTLSPLGSPLWCQPGLGAMCATDIEWIVSNAFWGIGGRPLVKILHTTPRVACLSCPGATSFSRNMVHLSAARQITPALLGFAFRALPSSPCSSLYILPLHLTQVFWLIIPSCLHQTKLPLEETKQNKTFLFFRNQGWVWSYPRLVTTKPHFPKFSFHRSSPASLLPHSQSFRCLKLPSVLGKVSDSNTAS